MNLPAVRLDSFYSFYNSIEIEEFLVNYNLVIVTLIYYRRDICNLYISSAVDLGFTNNL